MEKSQESDTIEIMTVGQTILEGLNGVEIYIAAGALATALQTLILMHANNDESGHKMLDDVISRFTFFKREFNKAKGIIDQIPDGSAIQ